MDYDAGGECIVVFCRRGINFLIFGTVPLLAYFYYIPVTRQVTVTDAMLQQFS